ncbi:MULTISPECIES: xanthine dehydrogenase family protein molybdopterin-binding subunit [unclassified Methylobacterium]|uniref:xanthine dehydrogenase family protein molybdopterin-binding subunit n=1 Tax=unclassified Methylobacterium TaxID=2615210 RepID=UPI0005B9F003|nr:MULTISPECIES: xanthine dehydrogenase family protein molybdopterin-binding subunit [unclassified Methylobacterium]WFS06351.1 xanthine dehydrogenase family protein molybdopterin-binding subunit [Methylobacterium sp. 391_Methyba4]SFV14922.1 isoquinoline 1-oxidoreductase, beta subunit [Methylobacterium sp. UNCCL125]
MHPLLRPAAPSRRRVLAGAGAALVLSALLPARRTHAEAQGPAEGAGALAPKPGTRVAAFLEIHPDGTIKLLSPFVEGGQGIATGLAQIVGEELDVPPSRFVVECAPPGPDYAVVNGIRMTGGSFSTRSSYEIMRRLGATARDLMIRAAAARLKVQDGELTTRDGVVLHAATSRVLSYGDLAADALKLKPNESVPLRDPATFRYIGQPVPRLDVRDKSTGRAIYAIDQTVEGMLYAAVQHAPRLGTEPMRLANEAEIRAMPGVHSVHRVPGAVAVAADSWWRARKAVEALKVEWSAAKPSGIDTVAADFSSDGMLAALKASADPGHMAEEEGDVAGAFAKAAKVVEAEYEAPYLAHAQLEPPSAIARFDRDGTLDVWLPNQMPEVFQAVSAKVAGLQPAQVRIHSPMLGGFFGRHFTYDAGNPFPQAILLARATGRPVKVLWSREEEFSRDAVRPLSFSRFRAALDASGQPTAIEARTVGEGPIGRYFGMMMQTPVDPSAVEGIVEKPYAVPNRRMTFTKVAHPVNIAFWRSVGHSMNDAFYESFLDEVAQAGGQDPLALRMALLQGSARHRTLLSTVAEMSGGWQRGPYRAEGGMRARGLAMASPFGSETATIAEVSVEGGEARVHNLWIAFDPGSIVNPAIVKAQVESAAALGLSSVLFEQIVYRDGVRQSQNYDTYPVLRREHMPKVHVRIVESGAPMGGVGEPGLPGVPPAVLNAIAALTGQRIRALPVANSKLTAA